MIIGDYFHIPQAFLNDSSAKFRSNTRYEYVDESGNSLLVPWGELFESSILSAHALLCTTTIQQWKHAKHHSIAKLNWTKIEIFVSLSLNKESFYPNDSLEITGKTIKENNENIEGIAEIYLNTIFLKETEIKNSKFSEKLSLPKLDSYEYEIIVKVRDNENLNFGESKIAPVKWSCEELKFWELSS